MDAKFIQQMKESLETEKTRIEEDLTSFAKKNTRAHDDYNSEFPDFGDQVDENAREVATFGERLSIERTLEKELRDVKKSLSRIEDGSYGICKYCGQELSEDRIKARPTSSTCVACKKKLKNEE
jgi:DnaK suppressor protein